MNKIGIIGYGVVGKAIATTFDKSFEIIKYDKNISLNNFEDLFSCPHIFLAVPTPFDLKQNRVDDSAVYSSLERLNNFEYKGVVIIKSTLPPTSTRNYTNDFNLNIVFNPEFLRESVSPEEDFANQKIVVLGIDSDRNFEVTKDLFLNVLSADCIYHKCTFEEAELIKYSQNMTLSSRVAISNLVFDACKKYNVDYNSLKKVAFDFFPILGPQMTQVPGPDGKRGFGGKCLPKDLLGFNSIFESEIVSSIIDYNNSLRDDIPRKNDNK